MPVISSYADAHLRALSSPLSPGELVINGSGFGAKIGGVTYAGLSCSVIGWSDTRVIVLLPLSAMTSFQGPAGPAPIQGIICVTRPDGAQGCGPEVARTPRPRAAAVADEERQRQMEGRLRELERRVRALEEPHGGHR